MIKQQQMLILNKPKLSQKHNQIKLVKFSRRLLSMTSLNLYKIEEGVKSNKGDNAENLRKDEKYR